MLSPLDLFQNMKSRNLKKKSNNVRLFRKFDFKNGENKKKSIKKNMFNSFLTIFYEKRLFLNSLN